MTPDEQKLFTKTWNALPSDLLSEEENSAFSDEYKEQIDYDYLSGRTWCTVDGRPEFFEENH